MATHIFAEGEFRLSGCCVQIYSHIVDLESHNIFIIIIMKLIPAGSAGVADVPLYHVTNLSIRFTDSGIWH